MPHSGSDGYSPTFDVENPGLGCPKAELGSTKELCGLGIAQGKVRNLGMELSFGGFQIAVLVAFVVITICLVSIFAAVATQARRNVTYERVSDTGYRLRRYWFGFLTVLLGSGLVISVGFLPYGESAGPKTEVEVTGYQFNWTVTPAEVPAGTTAIFNVTSSDVNHGLGLYDPKGRLIGNVQAMPDYHNQVEFKLDEPGTYVISCLEYCGLNHHRMIREFEVTP